MTVGLDGGLDGHFEIGPATVENRFTLTADNGQVTGIHELFGISFGSAPAGVVAGRA